MILKIKPQNKTCILIILTAATLLPLTGFAKPKPIMTTDLLQHLRKGEPWDRGVFALTKMVMFNKTSGDASTVSKITLSYFTTDNCFATNGTSVPTYTTPNGTSFTINTDTPFGMVAASAWNVGNTLVSPTIATAYPSNPSNDITNIQSIAVTLKSTNSNTPQASFPACTSYPCSSSTSFACIPVTCSSGECTSSSGTQSFGLKTTASIGDPADGGVIACMDAGNNLVTPTADNSVGIQWSPTGIALGATARSTTDGATNTTTIVNCYSNSTCPVNVTVPTQVSTSTYAAGICSTYTAAGGYTSGWFLPAGYNTTSTGQLNCLYTNRAIIGGFASDSYWSSTEASSTNARIQNFTNGGQSSNFAGKGIILWVRCSRAFTP